MSSPSLFDFHFAQQPAHPVFWGQLPSHVLGLVLTNIIHQSEKPWLMVVHNPQQAQALLDELQFFLEADQHSRICLFADYETLPFDQFSAHQDIISCRLKTLYRCLTEKNLIVIVALSTLLHRLPPQHSLLHQHFSLKTGQVIERIQLRTLLEKCAYRSVSEVMERGEYAMRAAILDLFAMNAEQPYRIEFDDDTIASIRYFDPQTQRSLDVIPEIHLLSAKEWLLDPTTISRFRQNWYEKFQGNPLKSELYEKVSQGISFGGIEYYLPLFFDALETFFDYLPNNTHIFLPQDANIHLEEFWTEIKKRYELYAFDVQRPILKPAEIFLEISEFFIELKNFCQIRYHAHPAPLSKHHYNLNIEELPDVVIEAKAEHPLHKLQALIKTHPARFLFCSESAGRKQIFLDLLSKHISIKSFEHFYDFLKSDEPFGIIQAPITKGFYLIDHQLFVISENEIYGIQTVQQRSRRQAKTNPDLLIKNLAELYVGAPVVHSEHGIGRYMGLQTVQLDETPTEFLVLMYAKDSKLYVPVAHLHCISRYVGSQEHAPLHTLGTGEWEKIRKKAAEKIKDVAAKLLEVYAKRAQKVGIACQKPEEAFQEFCQKFPFEETPDQSQAITDVIQDMTQKKVMDRLVCGDVGFGKTEVAMRAAFLAIQNQKQVVVLVPTTLLAQQHYENFCDRFAEHPIIIDLLSRFRTKKDQEKIIEALKEGKIDIIIGTHKLLQPSIHFKNLGLVIIDEEHRFGVQQKEKLKALRAEVDVLTLTATPIPRTLNMAFSGLRDLSLIATPPIGRLSIRTFILEKNKTRLREALLREILRGGQVFYVHNDTSTIEKTTEEISELLPEAKVGYAHGQMREKQLEQIMADFYHGRFNILVCTTIIETGIDIPTANTIIIDRADRFGFAQLHQLRGRVGRSHHQAYAYLIVPPQKQITADAKKRLDAFVALQDLGVGFMLATHDLEIRGAGEILGEDQSGQMQSIGLNLYMDLLEKTVESLKEGKSFNIEDNFTKTLIIDLKIPALIPEDYCGDVHTRLILYKRLAAAKDEEALEDLEVEFIDRLGNLPLSAKNLFGLARCKIMAESMGIQKIEATSRYIHLSFCPKPQINIEKLLELTQKQSHIYTFEGAQNIKINMDAIQDFPNAIYHPRIEFVQKCLLFLRE